MTEAVLVFVVEDEPALRFLVEDALTDGGFTVAMAGSGEEAMAMLDAEGAHYRALITDVNLRGRVTGWDVARRARELNDGLPVIYMSGGSAHDLGEGVPNSMLLTKPFALAQVVMAVAQLLNAHPDGHG